MRGREPVAPARGDGPAPAGKAKQALDAAEKLIGNLHEPPPEKVPAAVLRRQAANTLRMWQFCANGACRRAACCRGEPAHCLRAGLPLVPPEALAALLAAHKRPPRPARRAARV